MCLTDSAHTHFRKALSLRKVLDPVLGGGVTPEGVRGGPSSGSKCSEHNGLIRNNTCIRLRWQSTHLSCKKYQDRFCLGLLISFPCSLFPLLLTPPPPPPLPQPCTLPWWLKNLLALFSCKTIHECMLQTLEAHKGNTCVLH